MTQLVIDRPSTTPEAIEERRFGARQAIASWALEGYECPPEDLVLLDRYINGELTEEEMIEEFFKSIGLNK